MRPAETPGDGDALYLSHRELIERVIASICARHYLSSADAEEFASAVTLKLFESDFAILRKFEGRSSIKTYLTVVVERLFIDSCIAKWGKWRPSAEARRAGAVGMLLERLLTHDRCSFEAACEILRTNHRVRLTRAELEALAARLPVRLPPRQFDTDDGLDRLPSTERRADELVADHDREETARRVSDALRRVMATLDPQDRLILALAFRDNRSVADIAVLLGLDQKALYRRVDKLLRQLRKAMEDAGIHREEALEMFESPSVRIEWQHDDALGKTLSRPSEGEEPARGAH